MSVFDELPTPDNLNEAGICVVHDSTLLLGALVTRGVARDQAALDLAHRKIVSRLGNANLVRETFTAGHEAFKAISSGASEQEAQAKAREKTDFADEGLGVICSAIRRFPGSIERGDYACLHWRPGTPKSEDDDNHVVCSLAKGILRRMVDGDDLAAFREALAVKGIPTESFDAIKATVDAILSGFSAGVQRSELLEVLGRMKIDKAMALEFIETVREFCEGLDIFVSAVEGQAEGIARLEIDKDLRDALIAAVSSINEDRLHPVTQDGIVFERVNQPTLFKVVEAANVALWSKDHSDLTGDQYLAKRERDADIRGGVRNVELAKTRLHALWGPPHPGDNEKHSYSYVMKATLGDRTVFFEVSDKFNEETLVYWELSTSSTEDRNAVEKAFWRLLGLAQDEVPSTVPVATAMPIAKPVESGSAAARGLDIPLEGRDEQVAGFAAAFVKTMADFGDADRWDYSEESLEYVDAEITDMWGGKPPKMLGQMVALWGGYLGMVIRKHMDSRWLDDDENFPSLEITGKTGATFNPFNAMQKRLTQGEGDNILHKYRVLKKIYEDGEPDQW